MPAHTSSRTSFKAPEFPRKCSPAIGLCCFTAVALVFAAGMLAPVFAAPPGYTVQVIEHLHGEPAQWSWVSGLPSIEGQPFGGMFTKTTGMRTGVVWDGLKGARLARVAQGGSTPHASAPSSGTLVGTYWKMLPGPLFPVAWNWPGTDDALKLKPLDKGLTASAKGVNDHGLVVGSALRADGATVAVTWELPGIHPSELAQFAGSISHDAVAVNNAGVIAGSAGLPEKTAVRWPSKKAQPEVLAGIGGASSALAINSHGAVGGWVNTPGRAPIAAKWGSDGSLVVLPDLGVHTKGSRVNAMNDHGVAVGHSGYVATLWVGTEVYALHDLLAPASTEFKISITEATGIDNSGRITAMAERVRGGVWVRSAVLLTPKAAE